MGTQQGEEEFTEEEMRLGITIFSALYWFTIILLLSAIVIVIYLGFKGVLWYAVIPCWAACNFGLRVIKRYFRNILESFENDLEELPPLETAEVIEEHSETKIASKSKGSTQSISLVVITMLTVSAFWYCMGLLLRLVF